MRILCGLVGAILALSGCPAKPLPTDAADLAEAPGPPVLKGPSQASTIAIADDDSFVAMVLPEEGLLATFHGQGLYSIARTAVGGGPSSVVIHPDRTTAFVANRADGTVVRVSAAGSTRPVLSEPTLVGAEPTGLALSPSGALLFVAEFAEGRVSVLDATTLRAVATIPGLRAPRTVLVTNDGDRDDGDEVLIVPEYFGEPTDGGEAKDTGRTGRVRLFSLSGYRDLGTMRFPPLSPEEAGFGTAASPNQLSAASVRGGRVYVTATAVSPEGPLRPDVNVNPVLLVGDLEKIGEITGGAGSFSVAKKIAEAGGGPRTFLADLSAIAFSPQTGVAYLLSRGTDTVQRVIFGDDGTSVRIGSGQGLQLDVGAAGCQGPTGIALATGAQRAFLNCWLSRRLAVLDLPTQQVALTLPASAQQGPEDAITRGRRMFYGARGRLSQEGWSSCATCHPDGLSDNVTWVFPTGPRQSSSLDGTFSHGGMTPRQRALGWTATFDEVHDFEAVLREASGGKGAITTAETDCGNLAAEARVPLAPSALGTPTAKEAQAGPGPRCGRDWDDMDAFLRALRPPRGRRSLDVSSVRRGAALFGTAGCVKCHGGPGFSVSRRFYEPSTTANMRLSSTVPFSRPVAWPSSWSTHSTFQIAPQPAAAEVAGWNGAAIQPPQIACALRNVGTFGVAGDSARTDAIERDAAGTRAQGRGGYSVPALYGLALGAPFLHHGQAQSLQSLFSDARFRAHSEAGAPGFLQGQDAARDREDLISFLLSIDGDTSEQGVPTGFDSGCTAP